MSVDPAVFQKGYRTSVKVFTVYLLVFSYLPPIRK